MKKSILFLSFILTLGFVKAQIGLFDKHGNNIEGDTLVFDHLLDTSTFNLDFEHKELVTPINFSTDTMVVDVIREEIMAISGTGDYYCWGTQCFGEVSAGSRQIWKANDAVITAPDSSAGGIGFAIYLAHHNKLGEALYKYTFINDLDQQEKASLYVKYNVYAEELSLTDNNGSSLKNQIYPVWRAIDTTNRVDYFEFKDFVNLKNNTGQLMKLTLSRDEINVLSNVADSIVWNNVNYSKTASGQMTSRSFNDTLFLMPNQSTTTSSLKVYYFANDKVGESLYRFNLKIDGGSMAPSSIPFEFKIGTSYLTGIDESKFQNGFELYPNPAENVVSASFGEQFADADNQIQVYDLLGKRVFGHNLNVGENKIDIETSDFDSGVYFVNILSNGKVIGSKKLIVNN